MATDGYRVEEGGLAWTVDVLPGGQTTELRVQCMCQSPAAKTCNRVKAIAADGATAEDEACLEIRTGSTLPGLPPTKPAPSTAAGEGLKMTVIGLRNPVTAGKELTYEIKVTNNGSTPYQQLSVPASCLKACTSAPGRRHQKFSVEGKAIRRSKRCPNCNRAAR